MTYGGKIEPGDWWYVGRRKVVLREDGTVRGRCGIVFDQREFELYAEAGAAQCQFWFCQPQDHPAASCETFMNIEVRLWSEACCIAQQMVMEGLV